MPERPSHQFIIDIIRAEHRDKAYRLGGTIWLESAAARIKDTLNAKFDAVTPEELAEMMHEWYEEIAVQEGWETQKKTRVPFDKLPAENRAVMLEMARRLIVLFKMNMWTE